jgi:uncharacterized protein YcfJ
MKRVALLTLLATGAIAAQAQGQSFVDRARVERVDPQYESVTTPRQECTSQWVTEQRPVAGATGGYGGAIIGGVAGGVLGNQVGKGHGREAATAAGAVIGALAGDRIANGQPQQYEQAQREVRTCRTVNDVQQQLTGYRVSYEYRGNHYVTFMREQPGQSLPVRVSVTPVEEREYHRR